MNDKKISGWPDCNRPDPTFPLGTTIQESLLRVCEKFGKWSAIKDESSGLLSYKKLQLHALILAGQIRELPGDRIAVLLPSSVAAMVTVFAILLSGKIPVMLNWTLGSNPLKSTQAVAGFETIISSSKFLEKVKPDLGALQKIVVSLEEIKEKISWWDKLSGWWLSRHEPERILELLGVHEIDPHAPAVILFTSGTEAEPKGVPLSHTNLLSNFIALAEPLAFTKDDVFLSALPPFHSFGFSTTGLLPILTGVRAVYTPNPLESKTIAGIIEKNSATILMSAPLFLQALFQSVKRSDQQDALHSIRLVVSGSEKAPNELYAATEQLCPNGYFLEGYGLTECSPVIASNRPERPKSGVGTPLPGVELAFIDRETKVPLPYGQEGEICVSAPSVFYGYLGERKKVFTAIDGRDWLRTGDCGYIDTNGNLVISGRLKRFVKIGGEMVSLTRVERDLSKHLHNLFDDGIQIALTGYEEAGKKGVIQASIGFAAGRKEETIDVALLGSFLEAEGYSSLVRISDILTYSKGLPLTLVGKINYIQLAKDFQVRREK